MIGYNYFFLSSTLCLNAFYNFQYGPLANGAFRLLPNGHWCKYKNIYHKTLASKILPISNISDIGQSDFLDHEHVNKLMPSFGTDLNVTRRHFLIHTNY